MGEVYAGFDETLKRRVALKAIRDEHRLNTEAKARFLREAQILSQLDHPHICRVYDYIEGDDSDWLVLELIEGRSLRQAIDAGLDRGQMLNIAEQVAEVLVVTHAAGIVHRDLKPGNVMVARGGVKVLDFGLARSLPAEREAGAARPEAPVRTAEHVVPPDSAGLGFGPEAREDTGIHATMTALPRFRRGDGSGSGPGGVDEAFQTEHGAVMGTLAYMSPEQARGEAATTASDMYSLGLLLQEVFTGRPPYDEHLDQFAVLERAARGETLPPDGVDADLAKLIHRLKSLAPAQRPTAVDTLDRLRWFRDKPRRRLRRLAIAGALAAIALAGVKYTTDLARERTVAVEARAEAERRRTQAEDLIGFMLGDLRSKLEAVGRLEILDEVGARAMAYFEAVPEEMLSDEELLRRSKALYQIGTVRISQGELEAATVPLQESLALARALAERKPGDAQRVYELGQSHFWVGFVHWRRRDLATALEHFRAYLDLAQQLVTADPGNADWQLELSSANSNIGSVLQEQGDLEGALDRFRASLAIDQALLDRDPDDATRRRSLAASHNTVATVLRSQGRLEEALAHHRTELALQEELVRRDPGNANWRFYLGVSHNYVALILEAQGLLEPALQHLQTALSIDRALVASDPANMEWQRDLGRNLYRVGRTLNARGRTAAGLESLRESVVILTSVAATGGSDAGWGRDLADARNGQAEALLARGAAGEAGVEARSALDIVTRLLAQSPDDLQSARIKGASLVLIARATSAREATARAAEAWTTALAAIEPVARGSRDYQLLEPWLYALLGVGRLDAAKEVVDRLHALGYRHPALVRLVTSRGLAWPAGSSRQTTHEGAD